MVSEDGKKKKKFYPGLSGSCFAAIHKKSMKKKNPGGTDNEKRKKKQPQWKKTTEKRVQLKGQKGSSNRLLFFIFKKARTILQMNLLDVPIKRGKIWHHYMIIIEAGDLSLRRKRKNKANTYKSRARLTEWLSMTSNDFEWLSIP